MKKIISILLLFSLLMFIGCDGKEPIDGYINDDELASNIIVNFKTETIYTKYSLKGNLNYLGMESEKVPRSIEKESEPFIDSIEISSDDCVSYYLRLPLHITNTNWIRYNDSGKYDITQSTKYKLESRIYAPNSGYKEKVYYYQREDGGFIIRTFATNKSLKIVNPSDIECHAKWNIIVEYDKNGYLVREYFETINKLIDDNNKTVYGEAYYKYES